MSDNENDSDNPQSIADDSIDRNLSNTDSEPETKQEQKRRKRGSGSIRRGAVNLQLQLLKSHLCLHLLLNNPLPNHQKSPKLQARSQLQKRRILKLRLKI